jgi:hypothetical protein
MKEQMGSDRVFDVIGDSFLGRNLKDLIIDAIVHKRTRDEILAEFERIPDREAIQRVKEASMEALATRHIDLVRIMGEQRKAKENRLVPEYIEGFFRKAAEVLNIKMEKRQDGFWRIPSVPFGIRNQPRSFEIKFGRVKREYLKFSFDKERAYRGQAEFISMGHPLMEAVVETIFKKFGGDAQHGSTFIDLGGRLDGHLWFLEGEVKDGRGLTAGKQLFSIYQPNNGDIHLVNPSILWDLKPSTPHGTEGDVPLDQDTIIAFCSENCLEPYRQELLKKRERDAKIKRKYGIKSLDSSIATSEAKLADYYTRQAKGESIPQPTIQNEERNKENLLGKKENLLKEIEAESHLLPMEPKIFAIARLIPKAAPETKSDEEIERIGMEKAMEHEREHEREPKDVSSQNLGYDIRSADKQENYRYIEVKARAGTGSIALTPNEWLMAQRLKDEYWLYIVENAATEPALYTLHNPGDCLKPEEEIDIVRYIVKNWKGKSKLEK